MWARPVGDTQRRVITDGSAPPIQGVPIHGCHVGQGVLCWGVGILPMEWHQEQNMQPHSCQVDALPRSDPGSLCFIMGIICDDLLSHVLITDKD